MTDARPVVVATDEQDQITIDADRWATLAAESLLHEGIGGGELNILFVDESRMQQLNGHHMGKDRPTDVLSFPLDGSSAVDPDDLIGDIVICPVYAARHANDHSGDGHHQGTLEDELALLVVHGVLHILGHDHEEAAEAEIMEAREQLLLAAYHS